MNRPPRARKAKFYDPESGKWSVRGSEGEGDKETSADSLSSPKKKKSKMKGILLDAKSYSAIPKI